MLLCCIRRSEKELKEKNIIDQGNNKLEEDFNFRNVIDRMRLCQFETKQLRRKDIVSYSKFDLMDKIDYNKCDIEL